MVYRSLGVLFSMTGVTIAFAEFHENAGKWTYDLKVHGTYQAGELNQLLADFIENNKLQYQIALITTHTEAKGTVLGGASIAASTALPVITDLAALDMELGGNGEFYKTCAEKLALNNDEINVVNKTVCVAFMGILRWREEYNFLSSVTGASRSSIGGAIWLGQEA